MQFLYPTFLWALLALLIPIIIHLFYFRRFKKVMFTNVRFLKEVKEETSSRNKLKNLLILLMRCLAIASLVFAFAQPFISTGDQIKKGSKAISIFIDNSSSMSAELENVTLLDIAKSKAQDIVSAYSEDDKFQILTHDFEGKHQRLVTKEDAESMIEEIILTPEVKKLSNVIKRQKQILKEDENIVYLLSDFQKSITDIENSVDTALEINLLPIQSILEKNVSIDTAYFESPVPILNQTNNLIVHISNRSSAPVERVKISFIKDGQTKPIGVVDIPANTTITDTVPISILKTGYHNGIIKVTDFPIQFDDEYYVSFEVSEEVKVLAINDGKTNRYLNALFGGIAYFKLENQDIQQIQFQRFSDFDLILLNDIGSISSGLSNELKQYLENGGKVLIFPSVNGNITSYNSFLSQVGGNTFGELIQSDQQVANINTNEFVFNDVFETYNRNIKLPVTNRHYRFKSTQRTAQDQLLTYRNKSPFLVKNNIGEGFLYTCAAPLNQDINDLVLNAEIFVPMLYKMALASGLSPTLSYWIGKDNLIALPNATQKGENVYQVKGALEFIPGITNYGKKVILDMNDQIRRAGFYTINLGEQTLKSLAYNYDRLESELAIYDSNTLNDRLKNTPINIIDAAAQNQLAEIVTTKDQGIVLWKWFILAALMFLLLETVLIRLLKN